MRYLYAIWGLVVGNVCGYVYFSTFLYTQITHRPSYRSTMGATLTVSVRGRSSRGRCPRSLFFSLFLIAIADFYSDVMHCKFIAGKIQVVLLTRAIPLWPYYCGTIKENAHNISVKIHGLWPLDFFLFCLENHQPYRAHWLSVVDGPNNSACIHNTVSIYRCSEFYYYGPYVAPSWSCFWSISLLPWPRSFEHFVVTKQFT